MSSHHIVREDQEPALIIANGAACSSELLGQLLEWSPYILVLDGALPRVNALGIKVDAVLGDFDSLTMHEDIIASQRPIEIVHSPDQNKTDLEKGIEWLIQKGHQTIQMVWAGGLRADHYLNNLYTLVKYKEDALLVMLDDHSKIFPLKSEFTKWYPSGIKLSLMPVGRVEGVITEGLAYKLENEPLESGIRSGSSNHTVTDGMVRIFHQSGHLLLMECQD